MDFWIIRDGEKAGPFPDYEIRGKLEAGELAGLDPAWCEGMTEWLPLERIGMFSGFFEREPVQPPPLPRPPPLPVSAMGRVPVWRRFLARCFDLHVYIAAWWGGLWLAGRDLGAVWGNPAIGLMYLLPWFLIEGVLLSHFATTPGKWLLGIRVVNADGSRLSPQQGLGRAFRVFVSGIGFGIFPLSTICQGANWWATRKLGEALWDRFGGHRVVYAVPVAWRLVVFVAVLMASVMIQGKILEPVVWEKMPTEWKTFYREHGLVPEGK